jgi:hypothetical protein
MLLASNVRVISSIADLPDEVWSALAADADARLLQTV